MNLWLTLLLMAVVPASQPASQAATQPAAPRAGEIVINDAGLNFHFAVPKVWKAVPQQAGATMYVFGLPATGESRRMAPSFILTARHAADGGLAHEVDGRRAAIIERNAGAKFDEDAATTIAGHDGWTFAYSTTLNQTVTEQPGNRQHVEQVAIKVRDQIVVIDGRVFEFVLTSDDKGLVIRRRQAERAVSTLTVE